MVKPFSSLSQSFDQPVCISYFFDFVLSYEDLNGETSNAIDLRHIIFNNDVRGSKILSGPAHLLKRNKPVQASEYFDRVALKVRLSKMVKIRHSLGLSNSFALVVRNSQLGRWVLCVDP